MNQRPRDLLHLPDLSQQRWRTRVLEEPEAINTLNDLTYRNLIRYFMTGPSTVRDAAQHFQKSVQSTFNRVVRLERLGFLEVKSETRRAGKAIKLYQSRADDYFVPFAATAAVGYAELISSELQPLLTRMLHALEHHLASGDQSEWGLRLIRGPEGGTHLLFTPRENWQGFDCLDATLAEHTAAVVNFWGVVQFTPTQAKALQRDLTALWSKYYLLAMQNAGIQPTQPYIVGLSFTPEQP